MISAGFEPATSSVSPNDLKRSELLRRRANQLRQETIMFAGFDVAHIKPSVDAPDKEPK